MLNISISQDLGPRFVEWFCYFREISGLFQENIWRIPGRLGNAAGVAGANFRKLPEVSKKLSNPPDFTRISDTRYPVFRLIGQIYMIAG